MKAKAILIMILSLAQLGAFCQTDSDLLTLELEKLANYSSVNGFGVAIYSKDSILYKSGFGFADIETKMLYTTQTVQKVASISKLLLGVSVMRAQELNLLCLNDNVNDYLPFKLINPKYPNQIITIRHLTNHTAGLNKLPKYDLKALYFPTSIPKIRDELPFGLRKTLLNKLSKKINKNEDLPLDAFLQNLYDTNGQWYSKNHFDNSKAGERESYSNTGASLLALIIESASELTYPAFLQKNILSQLEMTHSGFDFTMKNYPEGKKSSLYHAGIKIPNDYKLILYPAGGFETNIDDFSIFMQSIAQGYNSDNSILTQASIDEMLNVQVKPEFEHGVLWEVYPSSTIGHQGDMVGVLTYAYYNKKQDRGYLLFCNTSATKTIYQDTDKIIEKIKNYLDRLGP